MTVTTANAADVEGVTALWHQWITLWNGHLEAAEGLFAPSITSHLAKYELPLEESIDSGPAVVGWIKVFRSSYSDCRLVTELGPFVVGDLVMGRWNLTGVFSGGKPRGATRPPGTPIGWDGFDVLRLEEGRIAEIWVTDNLLDVYCQVGAVKDPIR
jgi:hypothetical protein